MMSWTSYALILNYLLNSEALFLRRKAGVTDQLEEKNRDWSVGRGKLEKAETSERDL